MSGMRGIELAAMAAAVGMMSARDEMRSSDEMIEIKKEIYPNFDHRAHRQHKSRSGAKESKDVLKSRAKAKAARRSRKANRN